MYNMVLFMQKFKYINDPVYHLEKFTYYSSLKICFWMITSKFRIRVPSGGGWRGIHLGGDHKELQLCL